MKKVTLFFIVVLAFFIGLSPNVLTAQANTNNTIIHLDKSFYVTGEVIWFKLYLPAYFKGQEFMVKTEIKTPNGEGLDYFFLKNNGETFVDGYYKVPFTINTGVHHLVFSAVQTSDNATKKIAETTIPFYNDLNSDEISNSEASEVGTATNMPARLPGDLKVEVNLNHSSVKNRQAVNGTISVKDANGNSINGNISIAIRDKTLTGATVINQNSLVVNNPLPNTVILNDKLYTQQPNTTGADGLQELKFLNSVYTKAKLTDANGQALSANVLGAFAKHDNSIAYTKANSKGDVMLNIPDFSGSKTIQFLAYEKENPNITVALQTDTKVASVPKVKYTKGIYDYLNASRQRKKIFQLYTALEFNMEPEKVTLPASNLPKGLKFEMKNYTRFNNIAIFFKEVLAPLKFREEKDGTYSAKMYNPKGKKFNLDFDGNPLFIVDGKLTRDGNFIANLDIDQVEYVELYAKPDVLQEHFNILGRSGVAVVKTKIRGLKVPELEEADIFTINGLQAKAAFPIFNLDQVNNDKYQPFFRPQLYWNSNIQASNGSANFSFTQSDDLGTFTIEVVVQSEDGKYGYTLKDYEVVW